MRSGRVRSVACLLVLFLVGQAAHCPFAHAVALKLIHTVPLKVSPRLWLQVGEFRRVYRIHLPASYDGTHPIPLVLVFHGRLQTAEDIAAITRFSELADRAGFIVAYPSGIKDHWNDGRSPFPIWGARNYDDVGFVRSLIRHLKQELAVDPDRVYATGMSNGAMFVQRLACELSDQLAAIGPVDGTLPDLIAQSCAPSQPVSVIEFHGTRDAYVHWEGGAVRALGGRTLSVPDTIAHWQRVAACSHDSTIVSHLPHRDADDPTQVWQASTSDCQAGRAVVLYAVEGGGHTWPGGPDDHSLPFLGRVTSDVSATEAIWAFFAQHPKPTGIAESPQRPADRVQEHIDVLRVMWTNDAALPPLSDYDDPDIFWTSPFVALEDFIRGYQLFKTSERP